MKIGLFWEEKEADFNFYSTFTNEDLGSLRFGY
jgi:ABC-type xylose transport system substrate-binding protein